MSMPSEHRGPRPARVEVTGAGTASATPDVVRVALGIRCDSEGVAAALSAAPLPGRQPAARRTYLVYQRRRGRPAAVVG